MSNFLSSSSLNLLGLSILEDEWKNVVNTTRLLLSLLLVEPVELLSFD